ncbi:peptidase domain-containing ABC transporter [Nocardia beijingensis]
MKDDQVTQPTEAQGPPEGRFRQNAVLGNPELGAFGPTAFVRGRDPLGRRTGSWRLSWKLPQIPYRPQVEYSDCGPASLQMMLASRGVHVGLQTLRNEVGGGRNGSSASSLLRVARRHGVDGRGVRTNLAGLRHLSTGSILFWRFNHFVVLERAARSHIVVVDPAVGRRRITWQQADADFTGVAIEFSAAGGDFRADRRLRKGIADIRFALQFVPRTGMWVTAALVSSILLAFNLAFPLLLGRLVTQGGKYGGSDEVLTRYLVAIVASVVVYGLLQLWRSRLIVSIQSLLEVHISQLVMARLLRLPLEYFLTRSPGDLAYRTRSATRLKQLASVTTLSALLDAVMILGYVIVITYDAWWLALTLLACAGGFLIIIGTAWPRQRELSVDAVESQIRTSSSAQELLENIVTVKSLGAERTLHAKWSGLFAAEISAGTRKRRHTGTITAAMTTLQFAAPLVVLLAGLLSADPDGDHLSKAVALGSVGVGLFASLSNISQAVSSFVDVMPELTRINDILTHPTERASDSVADLNVPPCVEMDRVSFTYPGSAQPSVEGISFSIVGGGFLAILGRSGSGKSTAGMLLAGLLMPSSGAVSISGKSLAELDCSDYRSQVGYIDQHSGLIAGSILENIRIGNENSTFEEVREAARLAMIDDFISSLPMRYETILGSGGTGISGGQRQRIALARVLVRRPTLLILDEATSAVDPETERLIFDNIKRLGSTVISIGHRDAVAAGADAVLRMDGGRGALDDRSSGHVSH